MKIKRVGLIAILIAFSITCIYLMNDSYDRLARYQYEVSDEQREIIETYLSDDDINYMIQQHIKPEQFMDFIQLEGFSIRNSLYYEVCRIVRPIGLQDIVNFVNTYKKQFGSVSTLENLMTNYDYSILTEFYEGTYPYDEDATLIEDPSSIDVTLGEHDVLYKYVPSNLVIVDNSVIPVATSLNNGIVEVKSEVIEPLRQMCSDLAATNQKTCGGLILTQGYISYEDQNSLYEQAIVQYGVDEFERYSDYPGRNEHQLGYVVTFTVSEVEQDQQADSDQAKWLLENAQKYGFVVRYPQDGENTTGKVYQPFTLRYVGVDAIEEESFLESLLS